MITSSLCFSNPSVKVDPDNGAVIKNVIDWVEEFKIFLLKISHSYIKFYFLGFIPQQKNEKKVNTPTTKKKFNYRSLQQAKE